MKTFRFRWEITFLENLETTLFQSNCWGCESFSCDAMHDLPLLVFNYSNINFFKYGTVSSRKGTHFTHINSSRQSSRLPFFLRKSFKLQVLLSGNLLTFIVVMTTSLSIFLHIFSIQVLLVYVQFSFMIL